MRPFLPGAMVGVLLLVAVPSVTAAQAEPDVERARTLFGEGVTAVDRGDHETAVERFRAALALHEASTIHFNLGLSYYELGRLGRAADHFERVRDDRTASRQMRRQARRTLREIEPRLGTVTITLALEDSSGAEVLLDDWPVPELGEPVRAAEGTHQVSATLGQMSGSQSVEVTAGQNTDVLLPLEAPAPVEVAQSAIDDEPVDLEGPGRSIDLLSEWWFWTAVGIVAAGILVTAIVVAQPDDPIPVQGDLSPGVLEVSP